MIEIRVEQKGITLNLDNKEVKTPIRKFIGDRNNISNIETELRKLGIEYKIIDKTNNIVNLTGKELPFGCFKDLKDKRDYKARNLLKSKNASTTIPNKITYRGEMTVPKDQGNLGACVGFAVASMKEWQEQKEYLQNIQEDDYYYRRKNDHYNLSEQWIYYKAKEIDDWPDQEGTSIRCALKQVKKQGVPPEKAWVYSDQQKGKPESWAPMIARWSKGGDYWRVDYNELPEVLLNHGPLVIGIVCFREIFNVDNSGFVPYPKNSKEHFGGHAVCLISYHKNKKMFGFKNSWGRRWGDNGFGYLPFDYLKDFMLDAWIMKDVEETSKNMLRS